MRQTNALITHTDANIIGLYPLGSAPANTEQIATKAWLNSLYYMDNTVSPYSTYPDNRCPRYQDVLGAAIGALPNFYQYDVTRSGIPMTGAYFTYTDELGNINEIATDAYGYVGRYCMEENSYMNNYWNIFTFTQVGVCYPNNQGTTYPYPPTPQYLDSNFSFTISPGYTIRGLSIFNSAGNAIHVESPDITYENSFYMDSNLYADGTYFIRYFVYYNGVFVAKFGFRGYPAKKVIMLQASTTYNEFTLVANYDYNARCGTSGDAGIYYSTDTTIQSGSMIYSDPFGTPPFVPVEQYVYLYDRVNTRTYYVTNTGYVDLVELCSPNSNPSYGTFMSSYCQGVDLYYRYADGNGGFYDTLHQSNSPSCGGTGLEEFTPA